MEKSRTAALVTMAALSTAVAMAYASMKPNAKSQLKRDMKNTMSSVEDIKHDMSNVGQDVTDMAKNLKNNMM